MALHKPNNINQNTMNIKKLLTPEVLVPKVGNYLVEKGVITPTDLQKALEYQKSLPKTDDAPLLGQILIDMELVDRPTLDQAITEQILQLRSALKQANEQLERRVQERTAELKQALEKLSELDRLKSNFIANISHELRTPLTHIKGYIDLLISGTIGPFDDDQLEALKVISKSSYRLENLINDLILFSSIERGTLELQLQYIDLSNLCREITNQIQEKAQEKQIELNVNCPPDIIVEADIERISWVLHQLLDNAIKFTPNNGQVLLIVNPQNNSANVEVIDNGIGIPNEKIMDIFDAFHQLDSGSTRKYGGTGLGLALVREIIKAHGSKIEVISQEGKGSKFSFSLSITSTS